MYVSTTVRRSGTPVSGIPWYCSIRYHKIQYNRSVSLSVGQIPILEGQITNKSWQVSYLQIRMRVSPPPPGSHVSAISSTSLLHMWCVCGHFLNVLLSGHLFYELVCGVHSRSTEIGTSAQTPTIVYKFSVIFFCFLGGGRGGGVTNV